MGYERHQSRTDPGKPLPSNFSTTDPGFSNRKKMVVNCTGFTDPDTGQKMFAPEHKAKEIIYTQDAHQVHRCDACQRLYRSKYKMAHAKRKHQGAK
jgi:hypothetical protein